MGKGAYIGVSSSAKKIKKMYIGSGGVAKKVKKIYIGDANGKARLGWVGRESTDRWLVYYNGPWDGGSTVNRLYLYDSGDSFTTINNPIGSGNVFDEIFYARGKYWGYRTAGSWSNAFTYIYNSIDGSAWTLICTIPAFTEDGLYPQSQEVEFCYSYAFDKFYLIVHYSDFSGYSSEDNWDAFAIYCSDDCTSWNNRVFHYYHKYGDTQMGIYYQFPAKVYYNINQHKQRVINTDKYFEILLKINTTAYGNTFSSKVLYTANGTEFTLHQVSNATSTEVEPYGIINTSSYMYAFERYARDANSSRSYKVYRALTPSSWTLFKTFTESDLSYNTALGLANINGYAFMVDTMNSKSYYSSNGSTWTLHTEHECKTNGALYGNGKVYKVGYRSSNSTTGGFLMDASDFLSSGDSQYSVSLPTAYALSRGGTILASYGVDRGYGDPE